MQKLIGLIAAIVMTFLWFQPFVTVQMPGMAMLGLEGQEFYQTGQHFGGLAYVLLAAAAAIAASGYVGKMDLLTIAGLVGLAVSLIFSLEADSAIRWGLIGETLMFTGITAYGIAKWRAAVVATRKASGAAT